jgi:hypothetical protein
MSTRQLPPNPSLKSLRNQAKQLLHAHRAGSSEAVERFGSCHPRMRGPDAAAVGQEPVALADALLVVAREYGFDSWPKLLSGVIGDGSHFANEPGWEWALTPYLTVDISDGLYGCACGGERTSSAPRGCAFTWVGQPGDVSLTVAVAASGELVDLEPRPVGFDGDLKRHLLHLRCTAKSEDLGLFTFGLSYDEAPYGTICHLGVEVRSLGDQGLPQ